MDLVALKASTDELVRQFPQIEAFIDAQLAKTQAAFQSSLQSALGAALSGFGDGLGQLLALGYSIDGASIAVEFEPIVIRAKFTVNMPLKGQTK